MQHLGNVD